MSNEDEDHFCFPKMPDNVTDFDVPRNLGKLFGVGVNKSAAKSKKLKTARVQAGTLKDLQRAKPNDWIVMEKVISAFVFLFFLFTAQ